MAIKLLERKSGNHIYMKLMLDNKRIEEIDVYLQQDGTKIYVTSADHGMGFDPIRKTALKNEIIKAFEELYYEREGSTMTVSKIGEKEFKKRATAKLLQVDKNIKKDDLFFASLKSGYSLAYAPCYPETSNADFDVWCDIIDGTITVHGNFEALIPTIKKYKSIEDFENNL